MDGFPIALLKDLLNFKMFIIATGGDINLHQSPLHCLIRRVIYKRSNTVFAVSRDLARKIYSESGHKVTLLPTGVDPLFFRQLKSQKALRRKWNFKAEDIIALTISNLESHKGVDVAIETIGILRTRGVNNLKLIVVGDGSQKNLLSSLIAERNLGENVLMLGEKNKNEILELYNISDFYLLTSYTEGLPFALLEAMACEKICVCSPVGDIPSVIHVGYNGFLTNSVNPSNFAIKIENALALSKDELITLSKNARQTVLEEFDLHVIAQNLIDAISDLDSVKNCKR
jgi:glycosyltransferase involved in cell wall biosynthesis